MGAGAGVADATVPAVPDENEQNRIRSFITIMCCDWVKQVGVERVCKVQQQVSFCMETLPTSERIYISSFEDQSRSFMYGIWYFVYFVDTIFSANIIAEKKYNVVTWWKNKSI